MCFQHLMNGFETHTKQHPCQTKSHVPQLNGHRARNSTFNMNYTGLSIVVPRLIHQKVKSNRATAAKRDFTCNAINSINHFTDAPSLLRAVCIFLKPKTMLLLDETFNFFVISPAISNMITTSMETNKDIMMPTTEQKMYAALTANATAVTLGR